MSIATRPKPVRRLHRWSFRIFAAILAIVALRFGWIMYDGWQVEREWQYACAEADRLDPGWRYEALAGTWVTVPDERNSFIQARAAAIAATAQQPLRLNLRLGNDLQIDAEYHRSLPNLRTSTRVTSALRKRVTAVGPALPDALALADFSEGSVPLLVSPMILNGTATPFNVIDLVRGLLDPYLELELEEGNIDKALSALRAIVNTSRPLASSPRWLDVLLASGIHSIAANGVERILAQAELSIEALHSLQSLLESNNGLSLLTAFRSERAKVADTLQAFDNGKLIRNDVANSYLFSEQQASTKTLWVNSWLSRATGADFRRAYAVALLRHYTWTIERLKESPDGLLDHADEWATLRERMPSGKKTWMANLAANAIGVGRGEARYRCAIAAVAAEQFRLSNGRWPASLDELVPARLAVVPRDPFTSQPLRLARHPEGIVIYSVGDDKKDDGGDVHVGQPMGRDIGVRLWNVDKRRQPPR